MEWSVSVVKKWIPYKNKLWNGKKLVVWPAMISLLLFVLTKPYFVCNISDNKYTKMWTSTTSFVRQVYVIQATLPELSNFFHCSSSEDKVGCIHLRDNALGSLSHSRRLEIWSTIYFHFSTKTVHHFYRFVWLAGYGLDPWIALTTMFSFCLFVNFLWHP